MVAVPLLLALVHVALVAPHYHVGSFDDDASYILGANALRHGAGLTSLLTDGRPLIGYYPPGFSALLAPLVLIFGDRDLPLRLLSVASLAALFPMLWWYLGRRQIGDWYRVAILTLLALDPVLATYGSMVMAELPFLVLLIGWLILADRWDQSSRLLGPAGIGVVVAGAGLIWLKQAGVGLVVGLVLWLVVRRHLRQAAIVVVGTGVLLAPVVIARVAAGVPLAGARYSSEIGGFYQGGLFARLIHVVPSGVGAFLSHALPQSVLPSGVPPLPTSGPVEIILSGWGWSVVVFVAVGAAVWLWRFRDAAVVVVAVYLGEVTLYPYINERRVMLVLPLVVIWYVVGGAWIVRRAGEALRRRPVVGASTARVPAQMAARAQAGLAVAAVMLIVVPLAWQLPRNYLFEGGQSSSAPEGSPYMALLARLGAPSDIVESDYLSSTALFTGHQTESNAFSDTTNAITGAEQSCVAPVELAALEADQAAYLLTADLNKPGVLDSPCLLSLASSSPWAVRLLETGADQASVFELIGPGTVHPDLADLTPAAKVTGSAALGSVPLALQDPADHPGVALTTATAAGQATITWTWPAPVSVAQVSVGAARATTTTRVTVQEHRAGGGWVTIASAPGAVGDGGTVPYLLASSAAAGVQAVRVTIDGSGTATVADMVVLGRGA